MAPSLALASVDRDLASSDRAPLTQDRRTRGVWCDVTMSVCFLGTYSTEHMLVFFSMTHACAPIYVMGP